MPNIESYVVLDTQTTGYFQEQFCQTKITKISFIATTKSDIENTASREIPPHRNLTLLFNPGRPITEEAVKKSGLTNNLLQPEPTFKQKINTIISFLEELPKPIVLIANKGTSFAFRILLTEFNDAGASLPEGLLCVESTRIFQKLFKNTLRGEEIEGIHLIDKTKKGRPSVKLESLCKILLNEDITQIQGPSDKGLWLFKCIVAIDFKKFVEYVNNLSELLADKIKPIRLNKIKYKPITNNY